MKNSIKPNRILIKIHLIVECWSDILNLNLVLSDFTLQIIACRFDSFYKDFVSKEWNSYHAIMAGVVTSQHFDFII